MSYEAIRGMLKALNDPYTSFLTPEQYKAELEEYKGIFSGIGAYVHKTKEGVEIINVIPDTPAERAGLRIGDIILEVNGEPTKDLTLNEVISKIRGPKGTKVKLLILREGKTFEVIIVRDIIKVKTVYFQPLDDIAYIRISSFTIRTPEELQPILKEIAHQGIKGIVLDLRNNPGGVLNAVVKVADEFIAEGVVVYEMDRKGERKPWMAKPDGLAIQIPIVVLVNKYSASGSEVLAGALQDHKRGILIGTKTYGKGSINVLRPLKDGSGLYITTARWLTPQGGIIEGKGLIPDLIEEDKDRQLEVAIEILRKGLRVGR